MKTKEETLTYELYVENTHDGFYDLKVNKTSKGACGLCSFIYNRVMGEDAVGKITFQLTRVTGKANDYKLPFRIRQDEDGDFELQIHDNIDYNTGESSPKDAWQYAKYLSLLKHVIDIKKLKKWAGKSKFLIKAKKHT